MPGQGSSAFRRRGSSNVCRLLATSAAQICRVAQLLLAHAVKARRVSRQGSSCAPFRKAMFSKLYDTNTRMQKLKEMYVAEIYISRVQNSLNYHANGTMLRKQKAQVCVEVRTCCNKLQKIYTRVQLICTCVHVDVCTRCNKLLNNYWIPICHWPVQQHMTATHTSNRIDIFG